MSFRLIFPHLGATQHLDELANLFCSTPEEEEEPLLRFPASESVDEEELGLSPGEGGESSSSSSAAPSTFRLIMAFLLDGAAAAAAAAAALSLPLPLLLYRQFMANAARNTYVEEEEDMQISDQNCSSSRTLFFFVQDVVETLVPRHSSAFSFEQKIISM